MVDNGRLWQDMCATANFSGARCFSDVVVLA